MVRVTPDVLVRAMLKVPVVVEPVALTVSLAAVVLVTDRMVAPTGMFVPVILAPTSAARKTALAELMLGELMVVLPSVTVRGTVADGAEMVTVEASTTEVIVA